MQTRIQEQGIKIKKNTVLMILFWVTVISVIAFTTVFHVELGKLSSQLLVITFTYAATYAWFIEDTKDIGLIPSKALILGVVTAASICVPYYLIKYKGIRKSLLATVKFSSLFFVSACLLGVMHL